MPPKQQVNLTQFEEDKLDEIEDRFWSKVKKTGPEECWTWEAGKLPNGYGNFRLAGEMVRAHRVAFALANDDESFLITGAYMDSVLDHLCRNPSCVNPAHLELVTQRENVARGRCSDLKENGLPRGVYFKKAAKAFEAQISLPKSSKSTHLGYFEDPEIASEAYEVALIGIERGFFKTKKDLLEVRRAFRKLRHRRLNRRGLSDGATRIDKVSERAKTHGY